jgi:hypothetical protein
MVGGRRFAVVTGSGVAVSPERVIHPRLGG